MFALSMRLLAPNGKASDSCDNWNLTFVCTGRASILKRDASSPEYRLLLFRDRSHFLRLVQNFAMFVDERKAGAAGRRFATRTDSDSQESSRAFRLRIELVNFRVRIRRLRIARLAAESRVFIDNRTAYPSTVPFRGKRVPS